MCSTEAFERYAIEYDAWFERNPAAYEAELRAVQSGVASKWLRPGDWRGHRPICRSAGHSCGALIPHPPWRPLPETRGIEVAIGRAELLPFPGGAV